MTVMEASGPEVDMKRILSSIAKDRDGEWYALLLNRPVNVILSFFTSMENATMHKRIQSSFSIKYFSRSPRIRMQYWSVCPKCNICSGRRATNFTWLLSLSVFWKWLFQIFAILFNHLIVHNLNSYFSVRKHSWPV